MTTLNAQQFGGSTPPIATLHVTAGDPRRNPKEWYLCTDCGFAKRRELERRVPGRQDVGHRWHGETPLIRCEGRGCNRTAAQRAEVREHNDKHRL